MECDKDLVGEEVTGKVANDDGSTEVDTSGNRVDALPQTPPLPKSALKGQETLKTNVSQSKDDFFYEIDPAKTGKAVIFNHKNFSPHLTTKARHGTEIDCQKLEDTLRGINFDVVVYQDLTLSQLVAKLDNLAASDFSDCHSLFVVVLSHGGHYNQIYAKDMAYMNTILFDYFTPNKCPSLAGKPKIFVIQACRGDRYTSCIDVECDQLMDMDTSATSYQMPLYVDFLFAYSTLPEYYSWRNEIQGTWFVQTLCDELNSHCDTYDFLAILTFVNRRVAFDCESQAPESSPDPRPKQVSTFTSQLTRILKFPSKPAVDKDRVLGE